MSEWEKIIEEYGDCVWQTAYRLLGEHKETSECFQESFVSAMEVSRTQVVREPRLLLIYLATSKAIEYIRSRTLNDKHDADVISIDDTIRKDTVSVELLKSHELARKLLDNLGNLTKVEAEVFCLKCLSEMSYGEIGRQLGIDPEAIKVLESRAKDKLQSFLSEGGQD